MSTSFPATLVLEDGTVYLGTSFGAQTDVVFELVFNTSMTGYQEIMTDPSYRGQGVLFTVPHIGNVGINSEDYESAGPQVSALVIRSLSPVVSNWRSQIDLSTWMKKFGVPGIADVDTRALTRKLRTSGTLKAALSTNGTSAAVLLNSTREWPGLDGIDMVQEVTCREPYLWQGDLGDHWIQSHVQATLNMSNSFNLRVVLVDFGAKRNIMRHLASMGLSVMVVPANSSAETILAFHPDGVMLSNGPGDPAALSGVVSTLKKLIDINLPIFGICLGHQLIGLALGGQTSRLKFGHHGGNHPVLDTRSGKVYITSQNHNYRVLPDTLDPQAVEITHISLNDGSLEGFRLKNKPVYCVQFHPEAAPGPHDAHEIFEPFHQMLINRKLTASDNLHG